MVRLAFGPLGGHQAKNFCFEKFHPKSMENTWFPPARTPSASSAGGKGTQAPKYLQKERCATGLWAIHNASWFIQWWAGRQKYTDSDTDTDADLGQTTSVEYRLLDPTVDDEEERRLTAWTVHPNRDCNPWQTKAWSSLPNRLPRVCGIANDRQEKTRRRMRHRWKAKKTVGHLLVGFLLSELISSREAGV